MNRLLFEKTGDAVYISHLDLMRIFQRAFKRADIMIWHSQGFSPRAYVSIALPLPVGSESCCEILDFEIQDGSVDLEKLPALLNRTMPAGIRVLRAYESAVKIKHLTRLQAEITLEYDAGVPETAQSRIAALFSGGPVLVKKRTKSGGEAELDLQPMIFACSLRQPSRQELELTCDELRDVGDVLAAENAQHARLLKLTEENRLYDMMEAQTARQIEMLRELLAELQKTEDSDRVRHLLGQASIIGTYIKRRSNLIFVGVQRGAISVQELLLCLNESSENISVYGADCKAIVKGEGQLTVEQATQVYDLFEAVVETELESLRALLISIEVGKWVEVALCVSAAEPLCGLRARFPGLEWEQDEDGLQYVTRKLERSRG